MSSRLSTFISSLNLSHLSLSQTQQLHSLLITTDLLRSSPQPTTALISAYSRLRLPSLSLSSFLSSPHPPNLFHFNALISSLSSLRFPHLSLRFFSLLRSHPDLRPDHFSYPPSINSCSSLRPLQSLHSDALKLGLAPDKFIASALVRSYLELGFFDHARNLFDELPDRDVVLWNAMVTGFARKGEFEAALEYFRWMGREGVAPSVFTVTGVLSVFTAVVDVWGGRKVHGFVVKVGFEKGVAVGNALVDFYGKCHEVGDAEKVFGGMEERDLLTWNSMASAFQYNAEHGETLRLVGRMRTCGVMPDAITLAAVLPACSQVPSDIDICINIVFNPS